MNESIPCPFRVNQRIHELAPVAFFGEWGMGTKPSIDETRPDATVTAITDKGFTYVYDTPVPHGRAAWGQMMTGGECYPEGYRYWVGVD